MNEPATVIVLLTVIGLIMSLIAHWFVKSYTEACISSAFIASSVFCIIVQIIDPNRLIPTAFFIGSVFCLVLSAITGLPFKLLREKRLQKRRKKPKDHKKPNDRSPELDKKGDQERHRLLRLS